MIWPSGSRAARICPRAISPLSGAGLLSTATLTAAVTAASLYWLRPVMIPFVMALLFALILSPLIDLQMRYLRAPRAVALIDVVAALADVAVSAPEIEEEARGDVKH